MRGAGAWPGADAASCPLTGGFNKRQQEPRPAVLAGRSDRRDQSEPWASRRRTIEDTLYDAFASWKVHPRCHGAGETSTTC